MLAGNKAREWLRERRANLKGSASGGSGLDDGIRLVFGGRHFDPPATIAIYLVLSFRSSVYTGRMLPQPTLRVMKKERDVYEVEVAAARTTRHSVTAGAGDVERLTGGKANAERLIEESFRFLLERESNTSILRSFQITDISHYFPEYEREIRGRLGSLA